MNKLKKYKLWSVRLFVLIAIIAIMPMLLPKFPTNWSMASFASWTSNFLAKTNSQEKPSQNPCSYHYTSASMRRITVVLPPNGELSKEVIFTAPAGKCYWFEGPEGTEVWFNDGTHGPITKQYPPKIPKVRFSNPSGGILNIAIER